MDDVSFVLDKLLANPTGLNLSGLTLQSLRRVTHESQLSILQLKLEEI